MLGLLYSSGIRCMECLRLWIKDIDFDRIQLIIRDGKGNKDRSTMLPETLKVDLKKHIVIGSFNLSNFMVIKLIPMLREKKR